MPNGLIAALAIGLCCAAEIVAADTIYVSNEQDNTITIVDGKTLEPVETIPVGQRPRGIVLSKRANSLYISARDSDHIDGLDVDSNKIDRPLPLGPAQEFFARHRTGQLLL